MDEGNIINDVLQRTLNFIDHGFGFIQGDVYWLFAALLLINLTLAGLTWALSDELVLSALARRVLYVGFFAWLVMKWPSLVDTLGQSFVQMGIKAGGGSLSSQQFYNPGKVASLGWEGAWRILRVTGKLMGVRATFLNLHNILILLIAAIVYFAAFVLLAFQIFQALVQFKIGALGALVLLPMALINKTVFLAEKPIGWMFASGIRLMVLAVVIAIGLDVAQSAAWLTAEDLTIRQAAAAAIGALSLLVLGRLATSISQDLVSGSPSFGTDGMRPILIAGGIGGYSASKVTDAAIWATKTAAPHAGTVLRWAAMKAASMVPGGAVVAAAGETAATAASAALKSAEGK